jgi:3-phosphoshikimate 1-carboxyvinyltransferase
MRRVVRAAPNLRGEVQIPPDKSISHRAAILGALAAGESTFENFLASADCLATLDCLRSLGVDLRLEEDGILRVNGRGVEALGEPANVLDCGNSGTTMRLLCGLLAGRPFRSILTGDDSLRSRPMQRVAKPLATMGATVETHSRGTAPLAVHGGTLRAIDYLLPIPSAQVKSAILLAGLQATGLTTVREVSRSRDHTERMLIAMGAEVEIDAGRVSVRGEQGALRPHHMRIPGDVSSAAPWLIAGACHSDAELLLTGVGVNPTRTGVIDVLRAMGAQVDVLEERNQGGEPVADLRVASSRLRGVEVSGELIPRAVDELPLIALAATQAEGRTVVRDAGDLKVKESDRLAETARILSTLGARISATADGWVIEGPSRLQGATIETLGDHRLAVLAALAGSLAGGETAVEGAECVDVSYPGFWSVLEQTPTVERARRVG